MAEAPRRAFINLARQSKLEEILQNAREGKSTKALWIPTFLILFAKSLRGRRMDVPIIGNNPRGNCF